MGAITDHINSYCQAIYKGSPRQDSTAGHPGRQYCTAAVLCRTAGLTCQAQSLAVAAHFFCHTPGWQARPQAALHPAVHPLGLTAGPVGQQRFPRRCQRRVVRCSAWCPGSSNHPPGSPGYGRRPSRRTAAALPGPPSALHHLLRSFVPVLRQFMLRNPHTTCILDATAEGYEVPFSTFDFDHPRSSWAGNEIQAGCQ